MPMIEKGRSIVSGISLDGANGGTGEAQQKQPLMIPSLIIFPSLIIYPRWKR